MRNRAKCKLCNDIIESIARGEYVQCSCGEIGIVGGNEFYGTQARDYANFLRIDDDNHVIPVIYKGDKETEIVQPRPNRDEMLAMLDEMIKTLDRLPQHAMLEPITHADYYSLLLLLSSLFRSG